MNDPSLPFPNVWLARFAKLVVFATFALIAIGGHTTTSGAGMAFADWPLSNGSLNPTGWLSNPSMLLEHGHRLTAGLVAMLAVILLIWVWRVRSQVPRGVFALSIAALFAVLAQAVLGGLRVILDPQGIQATTGATSMTFRILHGCFAQLALCLLVSVAAMLSPVWRELKPSAEWRGIARLGWVTAALIYLQLIVGAAMRHLGAGLAIPTFPEANAQGGWMPATHDTFTDLNFTHTRVGAAIVSLFLLMLFLRAIGHTGGCVRIIRPACLLIVLLIGQVILGMQIIWQMRPPALTTQHVINGAAILATTVLLALRASRRDEGIRTTTETVILSPAPEVPV